MTAILLNYDQNHISIFTAVGFGGFGVLSIISLFSRNLQQVHANKSLFSFTQMYRIAL